MLQVKLFKEKRLFKFVYSEIRCWRNISFSISKQYFDAAKYANYIKNHSPRVRSLELKHLLNENKERQFLKSLFSGVKYD